MPSLFFRLQRVFPLINRNRHRIFFAVDVGIALDDQVGVFLYPFAAAFGVGVDDILFP